MRTELFCQYHKWRCFFSLHVENPVGEREGRIQISVMTLFLVQNRKILSCAELSCVGAYPGRKLSGSKVFSECGSTGGTQSYFSFLNQIVVEEQRYSDRPALLTLLYISSRVAFLV